MRFHSICKKFKFCGKFKNFSYYLNGRNATLQDYLNVTVLDSLPRVINRTKSYLNQFNATVPIWIGETADAYGGGSPNISGTFASGFLWLDELGISALSGVEVVIRETLFHSRYSLIDANMKPRPVIKNLCYCPKKIFNLFF